jgi:hypothetical protein
MKLNPGKQIKTLQKENTQVKKLPPDYALDIAIPKEGRWGNY